MLCIGKNLLNQHISVKIKYKIKFWSLILYFARTIFIQTSHVSLNSIWRPTAVQHNKIWGHFKRDSLTLNQEVLQFVLVIERMQTFLAGWTRGDKGDKNWYLFTIKWISIDDSTWNTNDFIASTNELFQPCFLWESSIFQISLTWTPFVPIHILYKLHSFISPCPPAAS